MDLKHPRLIFLFFFVFALYSGNAQTPAFNQEQQKAIDAGQNRTFPSEEELKPQGIQKEEIKKLKKEDASHLKEIVVDPLQGIWIGSEKEQRKVEPGIGSSLSLKAKGKLKSKLSPFLKKRLTFEGLKEIREIIETYFEKEENRTVRAVVPDQEATEGGVLIWVLEGKIGWIEVEGSRWGNSDKFLDEFKFSRGDTLYLPAMKKKLDWMNQNSFSQADLYMGSATAIGSHFKIGIRDRFPVRFYAGYDDSGSDITGDVRWSTGFNWGNITKWGDRLDYQFLTTSDIEFLQAHSLSYLYPLPWNHRIQISGSTSKIKGDFAAVDQIDLKGRSSQVAGKYQIPIPALRTWTHEIEVGVEAKQTQSDLLIRGLRQSKTATDIVQFVANYRGTAPDPWGSTTFEMGITESPGGLSGQNKDIDFREVRRNTDSQYRYGTFMLERKTDLILGVSLRNEARYQISNGNLLGSEQFGLGGWETVRGYDERESSGDEGWLVRNELWSPRWSFSELITTAKWGDLSEVKDSFQGYVFWDYGVTMNRRLLPNENPDTELSSVGLGLRYRISNYFSLRADYGVQLLDTGANKRNDGRFHLGATLSY